VSGVSDAIGSNERRVSKGDVEMVGDWEITEFVLTASTEFIPTSAVIPKSP
jgi:hypothetical protein